jgi:hypothetical protein
MTGLTAKIFKAACERGLFNLTGTRDHEKRIAGIWERRLPAGNSQKRKQLAGKMPALQAMPLPARFAALLNPPAGVRLM